MSAQQQYTERAQNLLRQATHEANRLNHEYIAPEHLLLTLLRLECSAKQILDRLNVNLHEVRRRLAEVVVAGPDVVTMGRLPLTPNARKIKENAIAEARALGHEQAGTEHILVAMLGIADCKPGNILHECGVTAEAVRDAVMNKPVTVQKCKGGTYVLEVREGARTSDLAIALDALPTRRRIKTVIVIVEDEKA